MIARRLSAVFLSLTLALGFLLQSPTQVAAFGRCDPGRSNIAISAAHGAYMDAQAGVKFRSITATLENNAIPYIEGYPNSTANNTTVWMMLLNENKDAYFRVGMRWTSGQGRLTSTFFVVQYTDEEGNTLIMDTFEDNIGQIGGSDTAPRVSLEWASSFGGSTEEFRVKVNGNIIHSTIAAHGAESFSRALIYEHHNNFGSQTPGSSSPYDPYDASNVLYSTQYGTGTFSANGFVNDPPNYAGIGYGSGWVLFHDLHC